MSAEHTQLDTTLNRVEDHQFSGDDWYQTLNLVADWLTSEPSSSARHISHFEAWEHGGKLSARPTKLVLIQVTEVVPDAADGDEGSPTGG